MLSEPITPGPVLGKCDGGGGGHLVERVVGGHGRGEHGRAGGCICGGNNPVPHKPIPTKEGRAVKGRLSPASPQHGKSLVPAAGLAPALTLILVATRFGVGCWV